MSEPSGTKPYKGAAGGWGALASVTRHLVHQDIPVLGAKTLLHANQPDGFDCPGCAWPDREHASTFEFCENGAKAVAFEATSRRVGPDFFAQHTVSVDPGRTHPQRIDHPGREVFRARVKKVGRPP